MSSRTRCSVWRNELRTFIHRGILAEGTYLLYGGLQLLQGPACFRDWWLNESGEGNSELRQGFGHDDVAQERTLVSACNDVRVFVIASYADSLVRFRGALLDALLAAGRIVHVAAPNMPAGSAVRTLLENKGVQVHEVHLHRTGTSPLSDFVTLIQLWKLMLFIRPSHVLAYTIKPVIYGLIAARMAGVPHRFALITGAGYAFGGDAVGRRAALRGLARRLYRVSLRATHLVFFQNPDDQALFQSTRILTAATRSVVVNGSGVDLSEFCVVPSPKGAHFLLIARLLVAKGVREYVEAARRVLFRYPDATFTLVGPVDDNPDAIPQVEIDGWVEQGVIKYIGRVGDVRPMISACSVYVLPSYSEGTPRTVLEAMAMARAIVTTDAPGCRETVVEGINGFLIPVRSVEGLVMALERFISEPELASEMGRRSREIAEDKYDVHEVNAVMLREMGL